MSNAEPSIAELNNLAPVVAEGVEREPVLLLDTSGSMSWPVAEGSTVSRKDVVEEAIGLVVKYLEDQDSQAAAEQAGGDDEEGGLLTFGFASVTTEIGDLNSSNRERKFKKIQWGGGTRIMPAQQASEEAFLEEFGDRPIIRRPVRQVLIITDGEAEDAAEFTAVLDGAGAGEAYVVAIMGFGDTHDATLKAYRASENKNPKRVRVVTLASATDPKEIADALISLVG